jgi:LmbE family N-acetylglucosaminyl deacetylase
MASAGPTCTLLSDPEPTQKMQMQKLLLIMAHPDDAEFCAGGLMTLWRQAGHQIKILCLTNGNAGHQSLDPQTLAQRRQAEAQKAADLLGAELEIWPQDDGRLTPSIELREDLIAAIRRYKPDLVITHRTADYHPDHRATGQLVKDSIYLLQVPAIARTQPPLSYLPTVLLAYDGFTDPRPIRMDWIVDTEQVQEQVLDLLACHASQVFEWLPSLNNRNTPPFDRAWLKSFYQPRPTGIAAKYRDGNAAFGSLRYAEAFEVSDYAARLAEHHRNFRNN